MRAATAEDALLRLVLDPEEARDLHNAAARLRLLEVCDGSPEARRLDPILGELERYLAPLGAFDDTRDSELVLHLIRDAHARRQEKEDHQLAVLAEARKALRRGALLAALIILAAASLAGTIAWWWTL